MLSSVNNSQGITAAIVFRFKSSVYETVYIQTSFLTCKQIMRPVIPDKSIGTNGTSRIAEVQSACVTKIPVKFKYQHVIKLDAHHAGCLHTVLLQSPRFCKGFLEYVKMKRIRQSKKFAVAQIMSNDFSAEELIIPRLVTVQFVPTVKEWIDYKWNYRILDLVTKRMIADDAMAWLNTLGGGYSALGDYFEHHAKEAGRISMKQFKISMEMGDEPTQIRCRLYFSLSLMQTGRLREAAQIIRWQYASAQKLPVEDSRLLAMCKGIWSRLEFLEQHHKTRH